MISADSAEHNPAPQAPIVANAVASVGRLPGLRSIFEATANVLSKAFVERTGADIEFVIGEIQAVRVGDAKAADQLWPIAQIFQAPELRSKVAIGVSFDMVLTLIDLIFGSNISVPFSRQDRVLTRIEARAAEYAMSQLIEAFQQTFAKVVEVNFKAEPIEPSFEWSALANKGAAILLCRFKLQSQGRQGEAFIAIPKIALDPFNEQLARNSSAQGNVEDETWARNLKDQVVKTCVPVLAMMEKRGLTLGDVARFQIGQVIELPYSPSSLIPLIGGQQALFKCQLGQKDGHYTVRVEEKIDSKQEFIKRLIDTQA